MGLPLTLPGIEVLDGRELGPSDVLGCRHYWAVRICSAVGFQAVAIPSGDAASQDGLDVAAVELFEDPRAHAKSFQPPEGKKHCRALFMTVWVCLDHDSLLVMWVPMKLGTERGKGLGLSLYEFLRYLNLYL